MSLASFIIMPSPTFLMLSLFRWVTSPTFDHFYNLCKSKIIRNFFRILHFLIVCVCVYVCVSKPRYICRSLRTTCGSYFFTSYHMWNFTVSTFIFLLAPTFYIFESAFPYWAQAGLKLTMLLSFPSAGITSVHCHAQWRLFFFSQSQDNLLLIFCF